jgi:hypothetical protein
MDLNLSDLSKLDEGRPKIETPSSAELERVISESKQTLAGEPPKKRGRKPKSESFDSSPAMQSLAPLLEVALRLPFDVAAEKYRSDKIRLSDGEAKGLALQADAVLRQYAPQMQGPEAAILTFALSLAMIAGSKYVAYRSEQIEKDVASAGSKTV